MFKNSIKKKKYQKFQKLKIKVTIKYFINQIKGQN